MGEAWSKVAVIGAVLGAIAVNAFANILRVGGVTTGEISARYPTAFTPAGYTFSIWTIIYLGLVALALAQTFSTAASTVMRKARAPFLVSCAANASWILLWHMDQIALSLVVMIVLLVSLSIVYVRLHAATRDGSDKLARWTIVVPISVYLGWICVATVANVAVWLVSLGVGGDPSSDSAWSVLMMLVALTIGGRLATLHRDPWPPLVFAWAFVGIGVAHPGLLAVRVMSFALAGAALAISVVAALGLHRTFRAARVG